MAEPAALDVLVLAHAPQARVLATGAWLKNVAGRLDGGGWQASSVHGDLGEPASCAALEQSVSALLASGRVDALAHDLHPDFYSTQVARREAARLGVPAVAVQHHHAHIAAVQAEHGVREAVIGLALDGVGLGSDGAAWGGELLWVDGAQFQRLGHLTPLALPGGDVAAREPWRMAAAVLHALGQSESIASHLSPAVGRERAHGLQAMLARGLNCPPTTSTGRWFDAAAGLLGLSVRQAHEAEAAMALEARAAAWLASGARVSAQQLVRPSPDGNLDLLPLAQHLLDLAHQHRVDEAAAVFHLQFAQGLAQWAAQAAQAHRVQTVALGGGCFFNRILRERVVDALRAAGVRVLQAQRISCGDAGLALGQAWVAAHRLEADAVQTEKRATCV